MGPTFQSAGQWVGKERRHSAGVSTEVDKMTLCPPAPDAILQPVFTIMAGLSGPVAWAQIFLPLHWLGVGFLYD